MNPVQCEACGKNPTQQPDRFCRRSPLCQELSARWYVDEGELPIAQYKFIITLLDDDKKKQARRAKKERRKQRNKTLENNALETNKD